MYLCYLLSAVERLSDVKYRSVVHVCVVLITTNLITSNAMHSTISSFRIAIRHVLLTVAIFSAGSSLALAQNLADFSLGSNNICVIDVDGNLECVTRSNPDIHLPPDDGTLYRSVSSGLDHSCGITQDGDIRCWGMNNFGQLDAPTIDVDFVALSAVDANHTCAIDANMQAHCWGLNISGQTDVPEPNSGFVSIQTGAGSSCGIKESGDLVCWTTDTQITGSIPDAPGYTDLTLGMGAASVQSCGLTPEGSIDCWAGNAFSVEVPNNGPYSEIASDPIWLCGLTLDGILDCNFRTTGSSNVDNRNAELFNEVVSLPPLTSFEILTQSSTITSMCGLTLEGELVCVGDSLPAITLPGEQDGPILDIPVIENLSFVAYSDTTIELFWDSINTPFAGRNIYRDGELLTFTTNNNSFIDETLVAGEEFVYAVSIVDFSGFEGPLSEPILVSTGDRGLSIPGDTTSTSLSHPGQPTNISITRYDDSTLELFWDRPAAFNNPRYQIFRNGEFLAFAPGPSFFDPGVNPDTAFHYTIVVVQQSSSDVVGVGFVNEPALNAE